MEAGTRPAPGLRVLFTLYVALALGWCILVAVLLGAMRRQPLSAANEYVGGLLTGTELGWALAAGAVVVFACFAQSVVLFATWDKGYYAELEGRLIWPAALNGFAGCVLGSVVLEALGWNPGPNEAIVFSEALQMTFGRLACFGLAFFTAQLILVTSWQHAVRLYAHVSIEASGQQLLREWLACEGGLVIVLLFAVGLVNRPGQARIILILVIVLLILALYATVHTAVFLWKAVSLTRQGPAGESGA